MTTTWERTAEFDAFGPWVMRVKAAREIPPLFRSVADLAGTRLAVKVPRPIERRDARPDMDLYDHLVLVREDSVEVLTRAPQGGVLRAWLAGSDLLALENSVALLAGRLRLHSRTTAPVEIAYNGSSADVVESLVAEVRRQWRPPVPPEGAGFGRLERGALGPADEGLAAHVRHLHAADPALRPLWLRPRSTVRSGGNTLQRLVDGLFPSEVHASVVCATESELVVVHRRDRLARRTMPVHSLASTVVPLGRGITVERAEDPRWERVVRLRLAPTSITLVTTEDDGVESVVRDLLR